MVPLSERNEEEKTRKERAKTRNVAAELNVMTDGLINLQHIFAIVPCKPTVWRCCALSGDQPADNVPAMGRQHGALAAI